MAEKEKPAKNIHSGHRERLKKRALQEGLDQFDDHQVLELLLFYAIPYRDTNELAHRLIQQFGGLSGVLDAEYRQLLDVKGVGPNAASFLALIPQICRSYQLSKWGDRLLFDNVYTLGEYCVSLFIGCAYEKFYLLCLDNQNRLIQAVLVNEGTINEVSVYPRLVVEKALAYKANSVVLSHNHPGGSLQASVGDVKLTKRLVTVLNEINISVTDHIIVSGNRYISLAAKGMMF
ncbi:MAG: DNA repair protein RadC [Firmicutes bacterium]|nr:DNA repair protein RadC [Bacillota bacterium]